MKRRIKIPLVVLASAAVVLLLAELAASLTPEGNAAIFVEDEQLPSVSPPPEAPVERAVGRDPSRRARSGKGPDVGVELPGLVGDVGHPSPIG